jgi:hypothetical protein
MQTQTPAYKDHRAWARAIIAKHERGEVVGYAALIMARAALGMSQ